MSHLEQNQKITPNKPGSSFKRLAFNRRRQPQKKRFAQHPTGDTTQEGTTSTCECHLQKASTLKLIDIQLMLKFKLFKQGDSARQLLILNELPKPSLPPSLELTGVFLGPIRRNSHSSSPFEQGIEIHKRVANQDLQPVSSQSHQNNHDGGSPKHRQASQPFTEHKGTHHLPTKMSTNKERNHHDPRPTNQTPNLSCKACIIRNQIELPDVNKESLNNKKQAPKFRRALQDSSDQRIENRVLSSPLL